MAASSDSLFPLAPAVIEHFRARAGGKMELRFDAFVDFALYDSKIGYYRQERTRVGYAPGTDFFTASTSGPLFGELICAACATLAKGRSLDRMEFVEIGPESAGGVLAGVAHPFRAVRTQRVGEKIELHGDCVIFSNELFDAQPFRRWVRRNGCWQERGVRLEMAPHQSARLVEIIWPEEPLPANVPFPTEAAEGDCLDLPLAANTLLETIVSQPWTGLFLAFDYGKSWAEISEATPAGTARAYYRHQQSHDLLARPGQQDLTCHVVWDWLMETLRGNRFATPQLESQEAFFVHHAGALIAGILAAEATRTSQRKLALMQLLHPAHLGQKFQVLHAVRAPS
jgi:SAM-dependent MidA family methyltransferase